MQAFLSFVAVVQVPAGGLSPLAWALLSILAATIAAAIPALWYRGNKMQDQMYADLKECNARRAEQDEEILGMLKVLRLQMEKSKGGKKG